MIGLLFELAAGRLDPSKLESIYEGGITIFYGINGITILLLIFDIVCKVRRLAQHVRDLSQPLQSVDEKGFSKEFERKYSLP